MEQFWVKKIIWSHRLTARTPGSHPGNRGSIPLGTTNNMEHLFGALVTISMFTMLFIAWPTQIIKNYKEKRSGFSLVMIIIGTLLLIFRVIYTSIRNDLYILIPDIIALLIQSILFYQYFIYKNYVARTK